MGLSNKTEPDPRCTPTEVQSNWPWNQQILDEYAKLSVLASSTKVSATPKQKPSQPFNRGDEAYLHGVLAGICAGHCRLKAIYKQVDQESWQQSVVASFETTSKKTVLIPIELPFQGSTIPDDWFLELKARIIMECGE